MNIAIFCHSLVSDWNHGNAHFLRGIAFELLNLGHRVAVYEPRNAWSVKGLIAEVGESALDDFKFHYPYLNSIRYDPALFDLERALDGVDLALVHEWNTPELVARIGLLKRQLPKMVALFHDTHHRAVTDIEALREFDLRDYDGALVFGRSLAELYREQGLAQQTWVWHEAADTRMFHPHSETAPSCDVVWVGNWGDEERSAEIREFLLEPVRELGLSASAYGVRYPSGALWELNEAGIEYRGWLPNFKVPQVLAGARITVHIPRMPYIDLLPGIPTIRVFEALACGIPLVCARWEDTEGLFDPDAFQVAKDGADMRRKLRAILTDTELARVMMQKGLNVIRQRHTCRHRAAELLEIYSGLISERYNSPAVPQFSQEYASRRADERKVS